MRIKYDKLKTEDKLANHSNTFYTSLKTVILAMQGLGALLGSNLEEALYKSQ